MTRIKICGITNADDAQAAVDAGADALGFIRVPESPRFVDGAIYPVILYALPPFVQSVAVIRRCEEEDFHPSILDFDAVQYYHGDCTRTVTGKTFCIRAFSVGGEASLETIRQGIEWSRPDAVLLDTYHKDKLGGSGETFDWQLAVEVKKLTAKPIILAGGLTPENVAEALEIVRPYAVDVASGVEASPGVKDHAKVRAFVRAVRAWDLRQRSNEG